MTAWQPIKTAPKDKPILGWDGATMTTVEWREWRSCPGYWTLCECGAYAEDGEWWPTHWMPLPEPPQA